MSTPKRIYRVTYGDTVRLVRAANKSAAVRHVADDIIKGSVAKQEEIVDAMMDAIAIETAGDSDLHPEATTDPEPAVIRSNRITEALAQHVFVDTEDMPKGQTVTTRGALC